MAILLAKKEAVLRSCKPQGTQILILCEEHANNESSSIRVGKNSTYDVNSSRNWLSIP